jgi:hypothetical protein
MQKELAKLGAEKRIRQERALGTRLHHGPVGAENEV